MTVAAAAQTLTISNARLIDVTNGSVHPNTTVVIRGNRIVSITHSRRHAPQKGQVMDAKGQYLIPGLWDMHLTVYFDGMAQDGSDLILPLFLANGITGIRDMGSNLDASCWQTNTTFRCPPPPARRGRLTSRDPICC